MFDLPNYSQLDKTEQDPIVDFPLDRPLVITGPPGSGKTVLGLYRLSIAEKEGVKAGFLIYNRTLKAYVRAAVEMNSKKVGHVGASIETWHTWFQRYFKDCTGQEPPRIGNELFTYDWPAVILMLLNSKAGTSGMPFEHLILDEGQDFPKEFYAFLRTICNAFTVFADENQRIATSNSTVQEIVDVLGGVVPPQNRRLLTKNYRNTREIARFAALFYCGLPSGIPALPDRSGPKPLCYLGAKNKQEEVILNECKNNKGSVGIFVRTVDEVKETVRLLRADKTLSDRVDYYHNDKYHDCPVCLVGKASKKYNSHTHSSFWGCSRYPKCTWTEHGRGDMEPQYKRNSIIVLTYSSAKGLEFDTVVLPLLSDHVHTKWNDENKMRFYVLTSRARNRLLLMKNGGPVELLDRIAAKADWTTKTL